METNRANQPLRSASPTVHRFEPQEQEIVHHIQKRSLFDNAYFFVIYLCVMVVAGIAIGALIAFSTLY